jgi:cell surface protein SprA
VLLSLAWLSCGEDLRPITPEPPDESILSLVREDWFWASIPDSIAEASPLTSRRGGLIWYNPVTSPVRDRDLFPELGDEKRLMVLTLEVNPRIADDPLPNPEAWMGLTQGISAAGANFTLKESIALWINDFRDPEIRSGTVHPLLHIDLGSVPEDAQWTAALPNFVRDTEDRDEDGVLDRDPSGVYEDTGLDNLASTNEPGFNPSTNPDPNDDDFEFDRDAAENEPNNPRLFARVNRFEDNAHLEEEDVNRDNIFQVSDNYLAYTIDLSDTLYVASDVCDESGVCGTPGDENGLNGWRLFRIPIEVGRTVGSPNLASVRHVRIWFSGFPDIKLLQIAFARVEGPNVEPIPQR